jgi:hypothetical protein
MGRRREALRRETGVGAYEKAVSNALELCGARSRGLRLLHGTVSKRLSGFLEFARLVDGGRDPCCFRPVDPHEHLADLPEPTQRQIRRPRSFHRHVSSGTERTHRRDRAHVRSFGGKRTWPKRRRKVCL